MAARQAQQVKKEESPEIKQEIKEEEASLSKFSPRTRRAGTSVRVWE